MSIFLLILLLRPQLIPARADLFGAIDRQLELPSRVRNQLLHAVKERVGLEPTPRETEEADKALALSFGLFGGFFADSNDTMDTFCAERAERREIYRVFVRRKFAFNAVFRFLFARAADHVETMNDRFCAEERQHFLQMAARVRQADEALRVARKKLRHVLATVQASHVGARKTRALCCSFWRFKNENLNAIKDESARHFFAQMMTNYEAAVTRWPHVCSFYREDACAEEEESAEETDNEWSLATNWVLATAKVCALLF